MGKFVIRTGWCGFAIACALFAASRWIGHSAHLDRLETILWPGSILPGSGRVPAARLGLGEFFAVAFSALMNGAFYAGLSWLVWWAARLEGIARSGLSEKARYISLFLAICLIFSALVGGAEAAIDWPRKLTAQRLLEAYLVSANLFALIVLTCALAGWAFWWVRGLLARRGAAGLPRP